MRICPRCRGKIHEANAMVCKRCGLQLAELPKESSANESLSSGVILVCEQLDLFSDMPVPIQLQKEYERSGSELCGQAEEPPPQNESEPAGVTASPPPGRNIAISRRMLFFALFGWTGVHSLYMGDKQTARIYFLFGVIGGIFTFGITSIIAEIIALCSLYQVYFRSKNTPSSTAPDETVGDS